MSNQYIEFKKERAAQEVAKNFAFVLENPECDGVINYCSGNPISVFDLVKQRCLEKSSDIQLDRDYYPYPDYEPQAFWREPSKLNTIC